MRTIIFIVVIASIALIACKPSSRTANGVADMHNSMNSLDWEGVYLGMLPCDGCAEMKSMLRLTTDMQFVLEADAGQHEIIRRKGAFQWNENGNSITLEMDNDSRLPKVYTVGEKRITLAGELAHNHNTSHYILEKDNGNLLETRWKLTALKGKSIENPGSMNVEAFLEFKAVNNRVHGQGGCNTFSGEFTMSDNQKISFSDMLTTRMFCPEMQIEQAILDALKQVDSYEINNDQLILKGNSASLATFQAVK
jgi:copper homeostasis protein (lipoprotein)